MYQGLWKASGHREEQRHISEAVESFGTSGGIIAHIRGDCMQKGLNALAKPQKASGAKGRSWRISDRTVRQTVGSFGGCQGRNTRKEYDSMGISESLGIWEQVRRRHIGICAQGAIGGLTEMSEAFGRTSG